MSVQPAYPPRPPGESPAVERRRLIRERDLAREQAAQLQAAHNAVAARNAALEADLTEACARAGRLAAERDDARELNADILDPDRWRPAVPRRVGLSVHPDQLASWRARAENEDRPRAGEAQRLKDAREIAGNFLAEYGTSVIPMFKVGQDLANSILKALDAPGQGGGDGQVFDPEDVPRCIGCGCTDEQACPGGCTWVPGPMDADVCSRCAGDGGSLVTIRVRMPEVYDLEMVSDVERAAQEWASEQWPADPGDPERA